MKMQVFRNSTGLARYCKDSRSVQAVQMMLFGLLLPGCTAHVEPQQRTVRVEVPVQVSCHALDVGMPVWATTSLHETDSLEVKVRALLAERWQRIGYEKQLIAALEACHD